jgi:predicted nucleic acid-binding protein
MRKPRFYLDTSVIGGYFDPEFVKATRRLFDDLAAGRVVGVISDLVLVESSEAPEEVRKLVERPSLVAWEFVQETPECGELADEYLRAKVVGERFRDDSRHVAIATVHRVLVSWNFRHIVRYDRVRAFNAVNVARGYPALEIRSPLEVAQHEE